MSRGPRVGRWLPLLAGLGLVLTLAAAALAISREGDVSNPGVAFTDQPDPKPAPEPKRRGNLEPSFEWAHYGYDKSRTRQFRLKDPASLHPPYRYAWAERGKVLLEFPPVLGRRLVYLLKNNGALYAMHRKTGRVRWKRKLGHLAAASPAYAHNTVYVTLLQGAKGSGGRVVALNAKNGHIRWTRELPSRSESSPLYDRGRLFFGSENGTVYCLDASNGAPVWTHQAPGAVKAALAMDSARNLYYGTYGGTVESLRARDGSRRWSATASGNFYSTPAVAWGRVFIGSTDGGVYSFGTHNGDLAWRHMTGSYVYGSPALTRLPNGGYTVFIGSYDNKLYALDGHTGNVRWSRKAEGRISGGTVVIGDLVWYSTLNKTTTAVKAKDGDFVWRVKKGAFNPVVSDGHRIFLVGYSSLFALRPKR
ncbi:MAG TPA: PQQ-binding-like beta-propeller repeat protein [Casimicrobiaceae bacterium]